MNILNENSKAGWGDDPKKPKEIDRIEAKAWKWRNSCSICSLQAALCTAKHEATACHSGRQVFVN